MISEDKLKTILYVRLNYKHRLRNNNKEINLVYNLTTHFYSWRKIFRY